MKKIIIETDYFTTTKKGKVMKRYGISEAEYDYIRNLIPTDASGTPVESFEATVPDTVMTTDTTPVMVENPPTRSTQTVVQPPQVPQNPVYSQPVYMQQQFFQLVVHDHMEQSRKYLDLALARKQQGCSDEEYAFYLMRSHEEEDMANQLMSLANQPVWNETSCSYSPEGVKTEAKTVNSTFSSVMMGIGAAAQTVDTLTKMVGLGEEIVRLFRGNIGNSK